MSKNGNNRIFCTVSEKEMGGCKEMFREEDWLRQWPRAATGHRLVEESHVPLLRGQPVVNAGLLKND